MAPGSPTRNPLAKDVNGIATAVGIITATSIEDVEHIVEDILGRTLELFGKAL